MNHVQPKLHVKSMTIVERKIEYIRAFKPTQSSNASIPL